jgi:hypothetical protein
MKEYEILGISHSNHFTHNMKIFKNKVYTLQDQVNAKYLFLKEI